MCFLSLLYLNLGSSDNALCARVRDVSETAYYQLYTVCYERGLLNKCGMKPKSAFGDLFA